MAARVAGLKPEQVHIHNAFLGGGFGRRDASDEIAQAIEIAKVVKRPVKLIWTREEDIRQDRYRPHSVAGFKAAIDSDGMPTAWSMRVVTSSIFKWYGVPFPPDMAEPMSVECLANNGYNVPSTRGGGIKNTHLAVWFHRAPGGNENVFAIESFVDEIASASGIDPYQMRRKLLKDKPDWLKVLDTAADKGDWGKPLPRGSGRGIAICNYADSLCAQVAEACYIPDWNPDAENHDATFPHHPISRVRGFWHILPSRWLWPPRFVHCQAFRFQKLGGKRRWAKT